jgi:hypothetical protein
MPTLHDLQKMKTSTITVCALLIFSFWTSSSASVSFDSNGGIFESLQINNEISFTITSALEDTSFLLVLNDVYAGNTFSPDEGFTPSIVSQPTALVNGSLESSFSFAWLVRESQWNNESIPFTSGYDPLDLSVVYYFNDGISLTAGDTVTLNVGTIFKQAGFGILEPDNLNSSLVAHLVAASFDQRISGDQAISIVPEASFAIPVSLLCLVMCLVHVRSRREKGVSPRNLTKKILTHFI